MVTGNVGSQAGAGGSGDMMVSQDLSIKGKIKNCRTIDIHGYVEGELEAENLVIHPGGRFYGTMKVGSADVRGDLQGDLAVKNLISIRSTGTVSGNVRYGRLAMEEGGNLSADMRNVPPEISGDLQISVRRGATARVTTMDLTAFDPDDDSSKLTYAVSKPVNGTVVLEKAPKSSVTKFTQKDLEAGQVMYRHDGSQTNIGSFDVVVSDPQGATSGPAQTVQVAVKAG